MRWDLVLGNVVHLCGVVGGRYRPPWSQLLMLVGYGVRLVGLPTTALLSVPTMLNLHWSISTLPLENLSVPTMTDQYQSSIDMWHFPIGSCHFEFQNFHKNSKKNLGIGSINRGGMFQLIHTSHTSKLSTTSPLFYLSTLLLICLYRVQTLPWPKTRWSGCCIKPYYMRHEACLIVFHEEVAKGTTLRLYWSRPWSHP